METETVKLRTVTVRDRSVGVGFNEDNELILYFVKDEGTAVISTQIKLSPQIAEQTARLITMAINEKEFEKLEERLKAQ